MPIYKPSELRQFLKQVGALPKRGLSQNFLIDGNILKKIVSAAHVETNDTILEIGPGPGALTEELLAVGAHIIAVEKDACLANALQRLQNPQTALDIYCDDIMDFPLEEILSAYISNACKVKAVANLPYHLTTPIIVKLIKKRELFSFLVLMVQEEVARRFTASPKSRTYGSFTVFLNFYSNPKYAFKISRSCFYPEPKVDSALIVLELKNPPAISDEEAFFKLTRTAFEHRRKMLKASLREMFPPWQVEKALSDLKLNPLARPEELSLNEFILLFEAL